MSDDRRARAHHEAGHAAVALALGLPLHGVSIAPRGDLLGRATVPFDQSRASDRDYLARFATMCAAGPVAQLRATRETGRWAQAGGTADWHDANAVLRRLVGDLPPDLERAYADTWREAERLVGLYWWEVDALAAALLAREMPAGAEAGADFAVAWSWRAAKVAQSE